MMTGNIHNLVLDKTIKVELVQKYDKEEEKTTNFYSYTCDIVHNSMKSYKALSSDCDKRKIPIPVGTCGGFVCPAGNLRIWAAKQGE